MALDVDEVEVASSGVELRRGDREDVEVVDFELDRAELVTPLADVVHRKEDDGVDGSCLGVAVVDLSFMKKTMVPPSVILEISTGVTFMFVL